MRPPHRDVRRLVLPALLATLGLLAAVERPAYAQLPSTPGTITFSRVEAKPLAPPGAAARLYWAADLPGATVTADDEQLRAAIVSWLSDPARKAAKHDWVLDPRTQWSMLEELFGTLRDYTFQRQDPFRLPPQRAGQPPNVEVRFTYRRLPLPQKIQDITIEICTEQATAICIARPAPGAPVPALDAQIAQVDLGGVAPGVTARGVALKTEVPAPEDSARLKSAFALLAPATLTLAGGEGITIGAQPADAILTAAQNAITQALSTAVPGVTGDRPTPIGTLDWLGLREDGHLRIFVRSVRIVTDVRLEVPLTKVDTVHGSPSEIADRQERALRLKAETERLALDGLAAPFDSLKNSVPTNESLRRLIGAVEREPRLLPPAQMTFRNQTLEVVARDAVANSSFQATVEGGWSAEDGTFGKGTFTGDNLLRLSRLRQKRVESESISLSGLTETQRVAGGFQLVTSTSRPRGGALVRGLHLDVLLSRDRDQLFGNDPSSRLSLASRRFSPSYELVLSSATRDVNDMPKKTLIAWRAAGGLAVAWGHVRTEEGGFTSPAAETGSYAGVTTTQELQVVRQIRGPDVGGVGDVRLRVEAKGLYAPGWLDFAFGRFDGLIDVSTTFGVARSRDYVVGYRTNVAGVSPHAPLFELPRLGGERLRGIEDGEFIGQRVGSTQLSAGPSLEHVTTWFGRKRVEGARLGPFLLADIYVTGFLDRGAAIARTALSDLLWPTQTTGYGVAMELHNLPVSGKRARLTLGYGRSPDSARHRRGTVVTAISLDLN